MGEVLDTFLFHSKHVKVIGKVKVHFTATLISNRQRISQASAASFSKFFWFGSCFTGGREV